MRVHTWIVVAFVLTATIVVGVFHECETAKQTAPLVAWDFRPRLSVGQEWLVQISYWTEQPRSSYPTDFVPRILTTARKFHVEALEDVDGETCFRIRVDRWRGGTPIPDPRQYLLLFIRKKDLTLRRVQRVHPKTNEVLAERIFKGGPAELRSGIARLPVSLPSLRELDTERDEQIMNDYDTPVPISTFPKKFTQLGRLSEHRINGRTEPVLEVELVAAYDTERTIQVWQQGLPWWIEAHRETRGVVKSWCRLISVDGQPIEVAERGDN